MPYIGSTPARGLVGTANIDDDAVTLAKIASGTDGELITWDASGNPTAVGAGTSGHFLKSQGAGSVPVFAAASNPFELVSTSVASDTASIAFTGVDDSADVWMIQGSGIRPATDNANLYIRHSTDGGSSYISSSSAYGWITDLNHSTTTDTTKGSTGDTEIHISGTDPGHIDNTFAGSNFNFTLYIFDPSDSAICTTMSWTAGKTHGASSYGSTHTYDGAGSVAAVGASNAFQFLMSSGNISTGRFTLYKIKHA